MSERPLLTVTQVCERLAIGRGKLDELFRTGKLTKMMLGSRSIRIDPDEVDQYLSRLKAGASKPIQHALEDAFDADSQFDATDNPFL